MTSHRKGDKHRDWKMSGEFITNVGGAGNRLKISFSEEKPVPKVSKLTLSSDFTHSYEESYDDDDDILIVDIDYGEGIGNEGNNRNEDANRIGSSDSPESIPRSNSLGCYVKKQRPKLGLRRFKSVEEVIAISPSNRRRKKKQEKTFSDYESRYKNVARKDARLTVSADFSRSYEEKYEEDDELLIVDIDYSQGRRDLEDSYGSSVNSAPGSFSSDQLNKYDRRYRSYEDFQASPLKKKALYRSISGYEITFTDEAAPGEKKKLSLSADLSTSSEEIVKPAFFAGHQRVKTVKCEGDDDVFDAGEDFVTSTPQKCGENDLFCKEGLETRGKQNGVKQKALFVDENSDENSTKKSEILFNLSRNEVSASEIIKKPVTMLRLARERPRYEDNDQPDDGENGNEVRQTVEQKEADASGALRISLEKEVDDNENLFSGKYIEVSKSVIENEVKQEAKESEVKIHGHYASDMEASINNDYRSIDLDDILIIDDDSIKVFESNNQQNQHSGYEGGGEKVDMFDAPKRAEVYLYRQDQIEDSNDWHDGLENGCETVIESRIDNCKSNSFDNVDSGAKEIEMALVEEENIALVRFEDPTFNNSLGSMTAAFMDEFEDNNNDLHNTENNNGCDEERRVAGNRSNELGVPIRTGNEVNKRDIFMAKELTNRDLEEISTVKERKEGVLMKDCHYKQGADSYDQNEVILKAFYENGAAAPISKEKSDEKLQNDSDETGETYAEHSKEREKEDIFNRSLEDPGKLDFESNSNLQCEDSKHKMGRAEASENEDYREKLEDTERIVRADKRYYKMRVIKETECASKGEVSEEKTGKLSKLMERILRLLSRESKQEGDLNNENKGQKSDHIESEFIFRLPEKADGEDEKGLDTGRNGTSTNLAIKNDVGERTVEAERGSRNAERRSWLGFRRRSPIESHKGKRKGSEDNDDYGVIPNGTCGYEDIKTERSNWSTEMRSDVDSKSTLPQMVNKVYRLKDCQNGEKIFTETVRIFLQQENFLSY